MSVERSYFFFLFIYFYFQIMTVLTHYEPGDDSNVSQRTLGPLPKLTRAIDFDQRKVIKYLDERMNVREPKSASTSWGRPQVGFKVGFKSCGLTHHEFVIFYFACCGHN